MNYQPESSMPDEEMKNFYKGPGVKGRRPPIILDFEDTDSMLDYIERTPALWKPLKRNIHIKDWVNDNDESGARDWSEAMALARHGWPDGRRLLTNAVGRGITNAVRKSRAWGYDTAGAIPDIPRYVAGDPEHMIDMLPSDHGRKPSISLCVSPMCPFNVTPQRRANWGAALLSWVEAEEAQGNRVDISVVYVTTNRMVEDHYYGPNIVVRYKLKSGLLHRSMDDIAFWLMHNAAHHRIQFAIRECLNVGSTYNTYPPYGLAVDKPQDIRPYLDENDILLVLGQGSQTVAEGLEMIYRDVDNHLAN